MYEDNACVNTVAVQDANNALATVTVAYQFCCAVATTLRTQYDKGGPRHRMAHGPSAWLACMCLHPADMSTWAAHRDGPAMHARCALFFHLMVRHPASYMLGLTC
jgi:hypothetical protein